ncbi:MAG: arginine--tRNA ligase [Candidatus Gracilibacteria bacterium]
MLKDLVIQDVYEAAKKVAPSIELSQIHITPAKQKSHGDYACSIAMQLAKLLGKSPMEIAESIKNNIDASHYASVEVAAPGFINVKFDAEYLKKEALNESYFSPMKKGNNETVILEYCSLNVGKPMNIGHLLNTIYGEAMNRLLRWYGYNVISDNHIGDWGTQFGKLLVALKKWGDMEEVKKEPNKKLVELYIKFHDEADKDPTLEDLARDTFTALEQGDPELVKLWEWIVEVNMVENHKIFEKLHVKFDTEHGEAFYMPIVPKVMDEMLSKGILTKNEDGSIAMNFEEKGINLPSCLMQKKDGSTLYHTRDVATIDFRLKEYNPKKIVYVVGDEQSLHFRQLFAIAGLLGWGDGVEFYHMNYGLFTMKEGKMSTRKGRVIYAEEVLDEAEERALAILNERGVFADDETAKKKLAKSLGYGAVFYANLSQNRNTSQLFDWDKVLSFEGNSAPYLQYVYARAASMLRKAKDDKGVEVETSEVFDIQELQEAERTLLIKLLQFNEVIESTTVDYRPNFLAQYLYELCGDFNGFYNELSVLNAESDVSMKFRLQLVARTKDVMKKGLELLDIEAPEKM